MVSNQKKREKGIKSKVPTTGFESGGREVVEKDKVKIDWKGHANRQEGSRGMVQA